MERWEEETERERRQVAEVELVCTHPVCFVAIIRLV